MRERPILFCAPMLRAILDGHKTQTRRIVKGIPDCAAMISYYGGYTDGHFSSDHSAPRKELEHSLGWLIPEAGDLWPCNDDDRIKCPYGHLGDRLWVREDHYRFGHWEPVRGAKTKAGRQKWIFIADTEDVFFDPPIEFRRGMHKKAPETLAWHKRLARYMPHTLSRIILEITEIRVERLQDISEEDARAEGVILYGFRRSPETECRDAYEKIWERINGAGSWNKNPWVWVVEFMRIKERYL